MPKLLAGSARCNLGEGARELREGVWALEKQERGVMPLSYKSAYIILIVILLLCHDYWILSVRVNVSKP